MPLKGRPDFSDYVVHFTKGTRPFGDKARNPGIDLASISKMTSVERLISMLEAKRILATPMPWTGNPAVCFTECTWVSLLDHSKRYSPFGIGFSKAFLFATGGAPAIYLRPDLQEWQRQHGGFDDRVWPFVTPFAPNYAPLEKKKSDAWHRFKQHLDYSHEREWRVPDNLGFGAADVSFVIVDTYADMAGFPRKLKDAIGRKKFLIMDIYREIERLWPTHVLT